MSWDFTEERVGYNILPRPGCQHLSFDDPDRYMIVERPLKPFYEEKQMAMDRVVWMDATKRKPGSGVRVLATGDMGNDVVFAKWDGTNFVESPRPDGPDGPILGNVVWWAQIPPTPTKLATAEEAARKGFNTVNTDVEKYPK